MDFTNYEFIVNYRATKFKIILYEPISRRFNLMLGSLGQALYLYGLLMSLGIIYGAP